MKKLKILNCYAGIGGNRKLWGTDHDITAVELDPMIAEIYKQFNPTDTVIVADAHKYLLEHFQEFDFIWYSPPCPSHSRIRNEAGVGTGQNKPIYPDMKLYEEILLLKGYFKGLWVVENVISWYKPLIPPYQYKQHYYWSNFIIQGKKRTTRKTRYDIETLTKHTRFDLSNFKGIDKIKTLRNCVEPESGLEIFNMAFKEKQHTLFKQD